MCVVYVSELGRADPNFILTLQQFTTFIQLCKAPFVTYATSLIYVQQF